MLSAMTTPADSQLSAPDLPVDLRLLSVPDGQVRSTAVRLDRLAGDLEAVAEPSEPDIGQRRRVEGWLALSICLPAGELSRLVGALAAALLAVTRGTSAADGDAAALSQLLQRELG